MILIISHLYQIFERQNQYDEADGTRSAQAEIGNSHKILVGRHKKKLGTLVYIWANGITTGLLKKRDVQVGNRFN
jgi:hypothetical protein